MYFPCFLYLQHPENQLEKSQRHSAELPPELVFSSSIFESIRIDKLRIKNTSQPKPLFDTASLFQILTGLDLACLIAANRSAMPLRFAVQQDTILPVTNYAVGSVDELSDMHCTIWGLHYCGTLGIHNTTCSGWMEEDSALRRVRPRDCISASCDAAPSR